jgi:hypothetical protein
LLLILFVAVYSVGSLEVILENKQVEKHEKLLILSLPHVIRAAADTLRATSDVEDKLYGLQEISRRLDQ